MSLSPVAQASIDLQAEAKWLGAEHILVASAKTGRVHVFAG